MDAYLSEVLEGKRTLLFDGAMGTMLQRHGLARVNEISDMLCLSNPEAVTGIHAQYVASGSQVITTNTFSTNRFALPEGVTVAEVMHAGVACARAAGARYVAADVSVLGELLDPYGDLEEDEAIEAFEEIMHAIGNEPVDIVLVETMTDLREAQLAIRAAKSICDLPVFASMSFGAGGATFMGVTPEQAVSGLREAGADVVGMNCSLGPVDMIELVERMRKLADCPILAQPNAGLPSVKDGKTIYDVTVEQFIEAMEKILDAGATVVGGCCGTDPSFIAALAKLVESRG